MRMSKRFDTPSMDEKYLKLLHTDRVLATTRSSVLDRLEPIADRLSGDQFPAELFTVLRALMERLIPQSNSSNAIDLAARLANQIESGKGDGWRYADMPSDKEALWLGLRLLDNSAREKYGAGFVNLEPLAQDEVLTSVQNGECSWSELNPKHWFEEMLVNAVSIYMSHPETMDAIGYSGLACWPAWKKIGLDEGEEWEPQPRS